MGHEPRCQRPFQRLQLVRLFRADFVSGFVAVHIQAGGALAGRCFEDAVCRVPGGDACRQRMHVEDDLALGKG
jgi:hypothetical protein